MRTICSHLFVIPCCHLAPARRRQRVGGGAPTPYPASPPTPRRHPLPGDIFFVTLSDADRRVSGWAAFVISLITTVLLFSLFLTHPSSQGNTSGRVRRNSSCRPCQGGLIIQWRGQSPHHNLTAALLSLLLLHSRPGGVDHL